MIPVTVAARHCDIAPDLRDRAEVIARRLAHVTPFAREASVVFDAGSQQGLVELRLHLAGGRILVASAEAPEHRTGLDLAEGRLRHQLERPAAHVRRKRRTRGVARA
jgi:ribosome-associated translation inhibitor RaiA